MDLASARLETNAGVTGSDRFRQVLTGSDRFRQVLTGSDWFRHVPTSSDRLTPLSASSPVEAYNVHPLYPLPFFTYHHSL